MYSAKIADKLSILYCNKSSDIMSTIYSKKYGVKCPDSKDFPPDGDLRIRLLEYYSQFNEEDIVEILKTNTCLKPIING